MPTSVSFIYCGSHFHSLALSHLVIGQSVLHRCRLQFSSRWLSDHQSPSQLHARPCVHNIECPVGHCLTRPPVRFQQQRKLVLRQYNEHILVHRYFIPTIIQDARTLALLCLVKNPSSSAGTVDVSITLNAIKCRYPNCEFPAQPGLELPAVARPATALFWSNDSHWSFVTNGLVTNGKSVDRMSEIQRWTVLCLLATRKPLDNTDIYIPRGIWMVIDYPLPPVRALRIDGVLEFEQVCDRIDSSDTLPTRSFSLSL